MAGHGVSHHERWDLWQQATCCVCSVAAYVAVPECTLSTASIDRSAVASPQLDKCKAVCSAL